MRRILLVLGIWGAAGCLHAQSVPWEERLQYYLRRTYSPQRLTLLAAETGLDQLLDEPKEWGREPHTYACRYSSAFGRRLVRNSIELGLGAVLEEDTRFRPLQAGGLRRRVRHALLGTFLVPGGGNRFACSRFVATAGGTLITSRWQPGQFSTSRFFGSMAEGYLGHLENSFLTEFEPDLKRLGKKLRRRLFGR